MSNRQLIKCFLPTPSTEPLQAHTPLILEFYYRSQTSLCFDLAAQPALSVPARLPLKIVDTAGKVRARVGECLHAAHVHRIQVRTPHRVLSDSHRETGLLPSPYLHNITFL